MRIISASVITDKGQSDGLKYIKKQTHHGLEAYSIYYSGSENLDKFCAFRILIDPEQTGGFTAIERNTDFWCRPAFEDDASKLPENIQCLLWQNGCLLPVCDREYASSVSDAENGLVCLKVFSLCSGLTDCRTLAFVLGKGDDTPILIRDCVKYALGIMGSGIPLRTQRRYPEIIEYLGWCSWNAFMTDVSEEKLLQKCEEFEKKGIPVRWAIIDDMWADCLGLSEASSKSLKERIPIMHKTAMRSFNADSERFKNGLSVCIG